MKRLRSWLAAHSPTRRRGAASPPAVAPATPVMDNDGLSVAVPAPLPADPMSRRILWTGRVAMGTLTLGLLALVGRVVQLEIRPSPQIAELVNTQHSTMDLQARRGPLLDRRGRILSTSDTVRRLYIDPQAIAQPSSFSERLGRHLGYDPAWVEQTLAAHEGSRFIVIDPSVTEERLDQLDDWRSEARKSFGQATTRRAKDQAMDELRDISAVGLETRHQRQYPMGPLAGQLLGFVGFDGQGMEGLEKAFNAHLQGQDGRLVYLRDAMHKPLWVDGRRYESPEDGTAVRVSLDATIQGIVDDALQKACTDFGAATGQAIVMDPYTGEVLAMANYPAFNPNALGVSSADGRRNRVITDIFEPGSIFKPVVWSTATQMGLARPTEMIDCTEGMWVTSAGRRLHDAHGSGMQTWDGVLIKSSNIGMAKVGERMGAEKMHQAVTAFGFGQPTGLGLEGESGGMVNQMKRWTSYSISSVPMGQEVGVTLLQMARAYCVFANGGYLIRPTLRVVDDPAALGWSHVTGRVLDTRVAWHTRMVLRQVVTDGTGKKAQSDLYQIFGKTGTAQIAATGRGGYIPGAYIGSFIGGAPLNRPRLIVAVSLFRPDPRKGHFGGIISAPAARDILEQSLLYLGVPPDAPPPQRDAQGRLVAAHTVDARE